MLWEKNEKEVVSGERKYWCKGAKGETVSVPTPGSRDLKEGKRERKLQQMLKVPV